MAVEKKTTRRVKIEKNQGVERLPTFSLKELRELVKQAQSFDEDSSVGRYSWFEKPSGWYAAIEIVETKEKV